MSKHREGRLPQRSGSRREALNGGKSFGYVPDDPLRGRSGRRCVPLPGRQRRLVRCSEAQKNKLHDQFYAASDSERRCEQTRLATYGGSMMHRHILESELVHLERVIASASQKPFPPTYWRDRVEHLKTSPQATMYLNRIARLSRLVAELDE
ncbi:hypothetical protein [Paraburkholderia phenoliruptrix]